MQFMFFLPKINLRLFDGEGAGAAAGGEGAQAGNTGAQTGGQSATDTNTGDLSKVKFGKQSTEGGKPGGDGGSPDAGGSTQQTPEEIAAEFHALVSKGGKYADAFKQEFQPIFDKRFKATKDTEERLAKVDPVMSTLAAKYGIKDADPDAIAKAIDEDNSFWETAAENAGYDDVGQYKAYMKLQADNERFAQAEQARKDEQEQLANIQKWSMEAKAVLDSGDYKFDVITELKNPAVQQLLMAGVDFRAAYETAHINDIKSTIAQTAAQSAEKRVTDTVRAKGMRPKENGSAASSGVSFNPADPATWTDDQYKEVWRRVKAGEKINL